MAHVETIMTSEGGVETEKCGSRPDAHGYEHLAQQNGSLDEPFMHSQGCPKYKVLAKMIRQARSPTRNQRTLHPKPWGARDPAQIPCTCGPIMNKDPMKSAPGSVRSSPVRELRRVNNAVRKETSSQIRKSVSPEREPTPGKLEVLKRFDEFCRQSDELGVKLSCATLDGMCRKIKTKFGDPRTISATPKRSVTNKPINFATTAENQKLPDAEKRTSVAEVFEKRSPSQQSAIHREASTPRQPSTIRSKVESSNVVVEIAGPNFPEPGATFPNIFGPMMPHERVPPFAHYVTLGGANQFFGPPEMLVPPIPTILTLSDSTDDYIPVREVLPPRSPPPGRRVPSPARFPRRRP